jgi:hypothetical protein
VPSRILVALRVAAEPQRAFGAFTNEIGQWWRPNGSATRSGGAFCSVR